MSLSASAASPPPCSILLLLLTAMVVVSTTATASVVPVLAEHRDGAVNTTTMFTNGSGSVTTSRPISAEKNMSWDWEHYYCFLCTGRHPLLIHYCPIYWDECHLNCWDDAGPNNEAAAATAPPVQGKECYVMKLYMSGSYVIVQRLSCDGVASCFLTCGGGELAAAADQKAVASGMGTTKVMPATIQQQQGSFVPFELCNTE